MNLAESLRVGMAKRQLTNVALAKKLDCHVNYVSTLKRDPKVMGKNRMVEICKILDCKVSEFVSWGE